MSLSIRTQIIAPLLFTICGGMATAAFVGYEAISGQRQVEAVVQHALSAKSLAAKMSTQFEDVNAFVKSVTDMTTFVSAADIKAKFAAANEALGATLSGMEETKVSAALDSEIASLQADHDVWSKDAQLVLGLVPSTEIPTLEKINRNTQVMSDRINALNSMVDEQAIGAATAAGELLSQEITNTLLVALGMGLVVLGILLYLAQRISRPIQMVTATMKELANGNTTVTAPAHKGTREIEAMTATVAVFRQSAINNIAMQESAEQLRQQMEQSRLDEQAKAEAAAAKRLAEATAGLALGLKRLAGGELNFQLTEAFAPEFETLRADFNQSVLQLEQTIVRVSQSVDTIRNGSHEMSRSADNLSRRTEQQAAMLEETAAALDEITANVSMSSQRTDEARDIAKQANSSAVQSGQVVTRAIDAMSRIETSSQKISNIIGVIDQIAFQTNLLALNAGVEAARAGDAGRGFAVVAMEVRELAQRSATAAKEIKELIQNSTQEVGTGVQLVSQTGVALKEIETFIVTINQHMDAIATSAREQTTGLSDVNRAINQMDQVTQQNAAMVEETNASGSTMAHETDNLQNLIGMFHTRHGASSTGSQMRASSAFARDTDFELQRVA